MALKWKERKDEGRKETLLGIPLIVTVIVKIYMSAHFIFNRVFEGDKSGIYQTLKGRDRRAFL